MVDDIGGAEASGVRPTGTGRLSAASRIGETVTSGGTTRRTILRGALLAGVATPLLAACADDVGISDEDTSTEEKSTSAEPPTGGGNGAESEGGDDTESQSRASNAVAKTTDVPEGSGVILEDDGVVITQPVAGTFNGFSNICTHQGCPLFDVTETINCNCHGSKFSIEDGSVVQGPAEKPLPTQGLVVSGNEITLG
ncbi:MAG TPA: Rieske (2Fe-2S) protein [Nocardioidaceae bacterium]|nr:Rieske (2Fe-2S) protein [Nocardioidaceae bacterium]